MLKRLMGLVGFFFVWMIGALVMPIVFWVLSGIILTLVAIYVVRTKKFGGGAPFFTGVGVVTALLATASFFVGGREPTDATAEVAVATDESDENNEASVNRMAEKIAAKLGAAGEAGDDADDGDTGDTGGEVDAKTALKNATAFSKNKKSCKSLEAIAAAWKDLASIPADSPEHVKAVRLAKIIEGCRKQTVGALTKSASAARIKGRMAMVKALKDELGAKGLKGAPAPAGKAKEKLTLKLKKATEEQIDELTGGGAVEQGSFLGRLQEAGFVEVKVSSGKINKSFALAPAADAAEATERAQALGLDQPLQLH